ncbi:MAG: TonB-dependent receptor [Rhodothermia bacterium]|nr:TonB-dependent receptor [Rhodothermia bacterium]
MTLSASANSSLPSTQHFYPLSDTRPITVLEARAFITSSTLATFTIGLFALALVFCYESRAQTGSVSGFVADVETGEPLELVNIVLRSGSGTLRAAVTSRDGLYVISALPPSRYFLKASHIGFAVYAATVEVGPGENISLNISLEPGDASLDEVLIESERIGGAANVTAGQQTVRPADIELVPAPDLSADLVGLLTSLPGVVALGDRGGQLFVRGGEPTQNLVQVDGMMVYQPFHIVGFYSAFPSDLLSRTDIYAGGFGSRFGERISSVIDVTTRSGNNRRFSASATLSPFISGIRIEGPIARNRWSFLASGRESLVDGVASRVIGRDLLFSFGDVFAKVGGSVGASGKLSATILRTHDRGTIAEDRSGAAPEEVRWTNFAAGMRLVAVPSITPVMIDIRISYSELPTELGPVDNPTRSSRIRNLHIGADATFFGESTDVDAGASVRLISLESDLGGLFQNISTDSDTLEHVAVYVEPEFRIGRRLRLRTGFRAQFFDIRFAPFLEPRVRLTWAGGTHRLSAAAGIYHQAIIGLSDRRDAASVFTAWTTSPRQESDVEDVRAGRVPKAFHALLGYSASPVAGMEISVEGYYKRLTNLFISEWTAFPQFTTRLQPATGRSVGADLRAEFRTKGFYGYVTYGLSSTRYEAEQASLIVWYGTETLRFRPPHDRRHQVNALGSTSLGALKVSARWEFGSGLPFSQAIGFDGFAVVDDIVSADLLPASRRVIYERPFRGVLPAYHRLDLSVHRTFETRRADFTVQASLINLYDRRNIFYLDVFTLRRVDQLPIIPSVGVKIDIK